ncbi:hypothetical protein PtrSN002B_010681 [Pyrenophora tritici-repentis]|nr:hypothetical protein PtrSN001A_010208 [Pyrenophora tritici-repentis]KAI1531814.1 hypothetical protein PtrSN002B_010681 [Pyrenophora tritici-repentis]KAI1563842.1 hypothetical protein PtrEW7m1_010432 [Pyrenophora tritici-repentis]
MVDVNDSLSSALDLIKRFADDWMQVSDAIDCEDLAALVDALDRLKKDAKKKLSIKKAMQASMESDWQPTHTGSAGQGIRRSHRIASAHRVASASSLSVTEQDTESEPSSEDDIPSTMLPEASPNEHTMMNAAPGILFDDPPLLPVHYENQAPIEELHGAEIPRERHSIEQEPPSLTLYTARPIVDGQDESTEVQPVQVRDGASKAQAHQAPGTDTQYQAVEDLEYIERQPGPESLHHSLVNHPNQDTTISPCDEFDFGEVVMHDLPSPQFFNEAFEDGYFSPLHHGAQTDVEEATAYPDEQHLINQDHTENFHDDPIAQSYDTAEGPDYIRRQPGPESPHPSVVSQPDPALTEQDATNLPSFEDEFGEVVMHDLPSPQFFNDAFEDYRLSSLHHESQTNVEEATADTYEQHRIDPDHTESFGDDPIVQGYLDLACRSSFRLPHEPVEDADYLDARELLLPLVEERPLTSRLIHALIYTLLPGPLRIFEVCSSAFDPEPSPEESPVDDFVAIIRRNAEALPLLVLGIGISKTLYILDSETVDLPSLGISWLIGPEWRTEHTNPRFIEPHMESTLLSVWIAETYFQYKPFQDVPSSRDLRLRFLEELLARYQRDSVLENCGIPSTHTVSQHVDTRCKFAHLETQVQTNEICGLNLEILVKNLENFEPGALRKALLQIPSKFDPSKFDRRRWLRILQCVDEIGSPHVLDSLKLACARKVEDQTHRAIEQSLFEKLFQIHIYLDKQESQSHLLVARGRYIKYCYFETFLCAVEALKGEKRNSDRERRKVSARKRRTTSFKKGISEELPLTPNTEEIRRVYNDLSPSGRQRGAKDMVKDEICSKVAGVYGGNEKRIRRNINKYINQGRVLHHILRGGRSLDPGLLILFPSFGAGPPSLSMAEFGLELQEPEEKTLSKPIELKE